MSKPRDIPFEEAMPLIRHLIANPGSIYSKDDEPKKKFFQHQGVEYFFKVEESSEPGYMNVELNTRRQDPWPHWHEVFWCAAQMPNEEISALQSLFHPK